MLERTATSIEPCRSNLHRVLPLARSCVQSRRRLHSAFWHHGAAELELAHLCRAPVSRPPAEPTAIYATPTKSNKRLEPMTASGLLLDFLYPSGTAALLQRPYPIYPLHHGGHLGLGPRSQGHMPRLFTSAAPRRSTQVPEGQVAVKESTSPDDVEESASPDDVETAGESADAEEAVVVKPGEEEDGKALRVLLQSDRNGDYDRIFRLYTRLEPSAKDAFTAEVLVALSASTRPVEAWRANELFAPYAVSDWTEELAYAAIRAHLTLHKASEAMSIYRTALEQRGFALPLDHIVAYGFELSSWDMVLEALELYFGFKGNEPTGSGPPPPTTPAPVAELTSPRDWAQRPETTRLQEFEPGVEPGAGSSAIQEAESPVESNGAARASEPVRPQGLEPESERLGVGEASPLVQSVESVAELAQLQTAEAVSETTASHETESVVEPTVARDAQASVAQAPEDVAERAFSNTVDPEIDMDVKTVSESTELQDADLIAAQIAEAPPVDDGPGYTALAATMNFEAKLKELYRFLENTPETMPQRIALADSFLRDVLKQSMDLFQPADVVFMLHRAQDPGSYERYIKYSAEQKRSRLAGDLYDKYRSLPGIRVADSVLRVMLDVYFPNNVAGMEQLLEEWYRGYGRLDERAYQKFMTFYGRRGDVKSIMRLAGEFAEHYGISVEDDPKFVANLMHAHAVRGDPDAANEVMTAAAEKSGETPTILQWNILLNAYTKAGDYEGAIELFSYICDELEPDDYTFATIMGMAGFRGDLQFALELFQLSRERNIQPTMAMLRALVEAYCQNDRFDEAEKLCARMSKERSVPGDATALWNVLVRHNARRRDLPKVNRLLETMSSQGVSYNEETYSQLLLALLYARQSHHAMHLLRVVHREGVFEPTADHFILLMAAFINSGEPHMALKTNELMAKMNFPQSAMRMTKVIDALGRWQQLPSTKRRGVGASHFLKQVLNDFYEAMKREDQGMPDDIRSVINLYSKVLFILTQMRQFATVHQIIHLHNTRYPSRGTGETLPLKLLHQIMLTDFAEKKFGSVKATWDIILRRAVLRYQPATTHLNPDNQTDGEKGGRVLGPVVYAQRFRLSDPLKTMQRLYLEERDHEGLIRLVATIRHHGFELDSKNWNYYIQGLARLKQWREAFTVCETMLMPQWTGWYAVRVRAPEKNQVPIELRRAGRDPQRPRPITHTLLVLAKEYMDLEQMMLWSREASREFEFVTASCPKTVRAVTSMHKSGSRLETDIFGKEERGGLDEVGLDEMEQHEGREGVDAEGQSAEEREERDERERLELEERSKLTWRGGRGVRPTVFKSVPRREPGTSRRKAEERLNGSLPPDESLPLDDGPPGVDQQREEQRRREKQLEREMRLLSDDSWTEGGFLNAEGPASQNSEKLKKGRKAKNPKKGEKVEMSEEDIINALKGG